MLKCVLDLLKLQKVTKIFFMIECLKFIFNFLLLCDGINHITKSFPINIKSTSLKKNLKICLFSFRIYRLQCLFYALIVVTKVMGNENIQK